jgi:hypothetical protein
MNSYTISEIDDLKNFFSDYTFNYNNNKNLNNKIKNMGYLANIVLSHNIKLPYNDITVKPSSIHGVGIFATENIPSNKIITFYPANAIVLYNGDKYNEYLYGSNSQEFITTFYKYGESYTLGGTSKYFGEYGLKSDPKQMNNPLCLGHLLNDGIGNLFKGISYIKLHKNPTLFKNIADQYTNIHNNINAHLELLDDLPVGFIFTSKNINKGEEIVTCYGIRYWYGVEYPNCKTIDQDMEKFGL